MRDETRSRLRPALDQLGTNLLTVAPGTTLMGQDAKLPVESAMMVSRIGPVQSVAAVGRIPTARIYRNEFVPSGQTRGTSVMAVDAGLLETIGGKMAKGAWLNAATAAEPAVVLGATTARLLGIRAPGPRVWLGGQWFGVAGLLAPVPLAPELDSAALVGWPAARDYLRFDGHPTTIYTRSHPAAVEAVRSVLAATANPLQPDEVRVSRPSDALIAQRSTSRTLDALLQGLGAVALLVGGIGVANTMVISVLERRPEIGLRRSLGATRGQIRLQFLAESLLLSGLGGTGGLLLGAAAAGTYAVTRGWPVVVPIWMVAGGIGATLVIGALAGLYPAVRAARLSPTVALTSP
jgi:putative ABC transport system permease protein